MTEETNQESVGELAGFVAGSMVNVYGRMFNIQIILETLRQTCGEPLLDIAIEYAQNTKQKLCDAQVKAGELFARIDETKAPAPKGKIENGEKRAYLRSALCKSNNWSSSTLMRIAETMGVEIIKQGSHGIVYLNMSDNEYTVLDTAMAIVTKMRKTQSEERQEMDKQKKSK